MRLLFYCFYTTGEVLTGRANVLQCDDKELVMADRYSADPDPRPYDQQRSGFGEDGRPAGLPTQRRDARRVLAAADKWAGGDFQSEVVTLVQFE